MNISDNAFVPTMDAQVTEHFADTDTIADADGVEQRNNRGAHAKTKEQTPPWVQDEFEWYSFPDKTTGETVWKMRALKSAVEKAIRQAPSILHDGIDSMQDEDHEMARQLCKDIRNLVETASVFDSYQEVALKKFFANQLARKAIYCARSAERAADWSDRVSSKKEPEPEGLKDMLERAFGEATACATLRSALLELDPTVEVPYKAAAWDIFKWMAYSNEQRYMNPDELAGREENEHSATDSLIARLRNRNKNAA